MRISWRLMLQRPRYGRVLKTAACCASSFASPASWSALKQRATRSGLRQVSLLLAAFLQESLCTTTPAIWAWCKQLPAPSLDSCKTKGSHTCLLRLVHSSVIPRGGAVLGVTGHLSGVAGDLYLLKLYRDFVLHQRKDDGTPNLDWSHLVESLNKLDAGLQEKVCKLSLYCVLEGPCNLC